MPSPFPGMDPYLEDPLRWRDVHSTLLGSIRDQLSAALRPAYFVQLEERVYLMDESDPAWGVILPDLAILPGDSDQEFSTSTSEPATALLCRPVPAVVVMDQEVPDRTLEIIDVHSRRVVAVIELLSPTNKVPGSRGMQSYIDKRREVLHSDAHWIEIDLLRAGARIPIEGNFTDSDYRVHVSRAGERPQSWVWPISMSQRLPVIPIPLKPEHQEAKLDLQAALNLAFDRAAYELVLQYDHAPNPPFTKAQQAWARSILSHNQS